MGNHQLGDNNSDIVQDLLSESMGKRFGDVLAFLHSTKGLTDNGSCYAAKALRITRTLELVICTTPVLSPESNGMAASFVKTFKRDYGYLNDLPNAATVMEKRTVWMEGYHNYPHKGLKIEVTIGIPAVN